MDTPTDPTLAADDLVGRVLAGRYRILAKLGEGAMGAVYVGEHLTIGRRDAIKVLRPALAGDAEAIARFTRGTRNVSAIQHPNVCTIYDFSETPEGVRFLAMEFIEGDTLKDVLERGGPMDARRAVGIARQVADALQAAHEVGVVHRDLKPGNIMLCRRPDGRDVVKVVDFDIAKGPAEAEGEEVTRVGYVVGTPEYMSPEQLIGDRLDGRSDLYSLGIVLFRMLAGQLPFRAVSTQELMVQRLTGAPMRLSEALPDAPPLLQRALDRALARKPEDRQSSATEFANEIAAAIGAFRHAPPPVVTSVAVAAADSPGRAPVGGPDIAPTRVAVAPSRRRVPQRAMLLLAGLLVAGIVAIAAFLGRPESEPPPQVADPPAASTLDELAAAAIDSVGAPVPPIPEPSPSGSGPPAQRTPRDQSRTVPGGIAAMLERQLEVLYGQPGPATLRAVRDSAERAWQIAVTRADSITAALVLAQAAFTAGDFAGCEHWARRGMSLGGPGFGPLLDACR